jgi:3-polyprenyl-4-hydroxybenzoate decarboxylase
MLDHAMPVDRLAVVISAVRAYYVRPTSLEQLLPTLLEKRDTH